jgi:hypothetical protein
MAAFNASSEGGIGTRIGQRSKKYGIARQPESYIPQEFRAIPLISSRQM